MPSEVGATVIGTASTGPGTTGQLEERARLIAAVAAAAARITFKGDGLSAAAKGQVLKTVLAFKLVPVNLGYNVLALHVAPPAGVSGPLLETRLRKRIDELAWALDATGLLGVREYVVAKTPPAEPTARAGTRRRS